MNTLYSYLKAIEQKLSAPEVPEEQFLNIDIYKNKNFNLKTLSLSIFDKIQDTTYLLNQLKLTIEKAKNEIVDQINSNYNNYVTLISKLQTIDFLIDNIQQSFQKIKNKIDNKLNLVGKYEKEFIEMLNFIKENDNEIQKIQIMIKEYETNIKANKIKEKIEIYTTNNSLAIKEKKYTQIRQLLFLFTNYFSLIKDDEKKFLDYFTVIEEILYYYTENYFIKQNNTEINLKLDLNIFSLIFKIYKYTNKENDFHLKIYNGFIKAIFNKICDTNNKQISDIITDLINYMNSEKIKELNLLFQPSDNFNKICFLKPFINKLIKEKFLFNCTDVNIFLVNYKCILKYIKMFKLENNNDDLNEVRSFLYNFSFFTYFQYMQNDLCLDLVELIQEKNKNNSAVIVSNAIRNYIKKIREIMHEQKIMLKILPNFLTFILQCNTLIKNKINETLETIKNNTNIKGEVINEFNNNLNEYNNFFKNNGEFYQSIINDVYENEEFLIKTEEEKDEFKNSILELLVDKEDEN